MIHMRLILNGEGEWPDLTTKDVVHLGEGTALQIAVMPAGMESGRPSVAFRFDLPDGRVVIAETSWRLLRTVCDAISARYGSGGE